MRIINIISKKIKGENFNLDSRISNLYILRVSIYMIIKLLRGNIKSIFVKKKSNIIFVGKKTKLRARRMIEIGKKVNIGEYVTIDGLSMEGVSIGNGVKIGDYTRIICTGSMQDIGKGIKIGNNCGISENVFFGAAGGIKIGNNVIMGQDVRFHSENHMYNNVHVPIKDQGVSRKGIEVGDDCWIGSGVVFLDGVKVGNGCVIGANTLVNKSLPDCCVAVGNPVKIVKQRR